MPFTQSTVLGRRVLIDDWMGFHRDRLLHTLYQMRDSGGDDNGITLEQISNVTGLDRGLAAELVLWMSPRLIRMRGPDLMWRITARGVRWAEESPAPP